MANPEEDDGLEPWERYEKLKKEEWAEDVAAGRAATPMSVSGERALTFWHELFTGTFTGAAIDASPTTLARVLKVLSDADLLLARLFGGGAVRTGLWFDPKFAVEQAADLGKEWGDDHPVVATLRKVGRAWLDAGIDHQVPMNPHILFAAMLYWVQGNEFTWATYEAMMPRLFRITAQELYRRLHLLGDPGQQAQGQTTIDQLAELPVRVVSPVFVRFENKGWGLKTADFGPYAWIEIVHDELKVAPSGRHLATLTRTAKGEYWVVADPSVPGRQAFTNVVIGPAMVPDGWTQPDDDPADPAPASGPCEPSGPASPAADPPAPG